MYRYRVIREKDMTVKEETIKVAGPKTIHNAYKEYFESLDREHFEILHLNNKNHIVAKETISIGSLNSSLVHPREVFKSAVIKSSASIILLHNHPSGETEPSCEDISVTKRLVEAGNIIGIEVLDHIIIGDGVYFSFKEENLL